MGLSNLFNNRASRMFGVYEGRLAKQLGVSGEELATKVYNDINTVNRSGKVGKAEMRNYVDSAFGKPPGGTRMADSERVTSSMGNDSPLAASIRDKALNNQNLKQETAAVTKDGKFSYFSGPERGRTVYNDGSKAYGEGFRNFKRDSVPALYVPPTSPKLPPKTGSVFKMDPSDAGWKQSLKAGGNAVFDGLDSLEKSGKLTKTFMKGAAFPVLGAAAGAGVGAAGSVVMPNNFENEGFTRSAFKGAATGLALGLTHKFSSGALSHMNKLNDLGKAGDSAAWMTKSLEMTKKVTGSKVTMGAIGAASFGGSFNYNMTKPINGGNY